MSARATPQRLDPLGGLTAQYFTWCISFISVAVAVVQLARHNGDIQSWPAQALAVVLIAIAAAIVADGASPRRFPFGAGRHATVYVLGVLAVVMDCLSRASGPGQAAIWAPVSLAILLLMMGSYRPSGEILVFSAIASLVVAAVVVAASSGLTTADATAIAIARAAPIAAIGLGSAAFSGVLVARLRTWLQSRDENAAREREAMREELLAEVWQDRQDLIEYRVGPFLESVFSTGTITSADIARARGLASSMRRTMLHEATRTWLTAVADDVDDPTLLANRLGGEQRTALGGLMSELREVDTLVPGTLAVTLTTTGPHGRAQLTARFTGDGVAPSRIAAYLAVLRTYFRKATIVSTPTSIQVVVEFDLDETR